MLRPFISILAVLWGILTVIISSLLFVSPLVPSKGTILLTNDLTLSRWERFQFYDVSRRIEYGFTPDTGENALFISLAPRTRLMAFLNVNINRLNLTINDYQGRPLISAIPVASVKDFSEASWADRGRYFLYYDSITRRGSSIIILDTQSGDRREIRTREAERPSASRSPDGTAIAYTNRSGRNSLSEIWISDIDGQNTRQLTATQGDAYCPVWSPDGERIAYLEALVPGDRIHFVYRDGTEIGTFQDSLFVTVCPQWSPDGKSLFLIALNPETMRAAVFMMNVESGQASPILNVNQTASLQIWR